MTETDPLGAVTQYSYDAAGNLVAVTDPSGQQASYERDAQGRAVAFTDRNQQTTSFVYASAADAEASVVTYPDGSTVNVTYNGFGFSHASRQRPGLRPDRGLRSRGTGRASCAIRKAAS